MTAAIDREHIDGAGGPSERLQPVAEEKVTVVFYKSDPTRPFAPGGRRLSVCLMIGFGSGLTNPSELAVITGYRVEKKARRIENIFPVAVAHEWGDGDWADVRQGNGSFPMSADSVEVQRVECYLAYGMKSQG